MRTVLDFHQGGLGAISSSRCQTTRARTGEPARARIFLSFWTSRTGRQRRAREAHRASPVEFTSAELVRVERQVRVAADRSPIGIDRRSGGARRDRTDDLLLAKQALSQLSYGPSGIRYQRSVIRNATYGPSDY
jgi:hypothetical protein